MLSEQLARPPDVASVDPLGGYSSSYSSSRRIHDVRPVALSPAQLSQRAGPPKPGTGAASGPTGLPPKVPLQPLAAAAGPSSLSSAVDASAAITQPSPVRIKTELARSDHWAQVAQEAKEAERLELERLKADKVAKAAQVREELTRQILEHQSAKRQQKEDTVEQYKKTVAEAQESLTVEQRKAIELKKKRADELALAKAARLELEQRKKDRFVQQRSERVAVESSMLSDQEKEAQELRDKKQKSLAVRDGLVKHFEEQHRIKQQLAEQRRVEEDKELRVAAEMEEVARKREKARQAESVAKAKDALKFCQSMLAQRNEKEREEQAHFDKAVLSDDDAANEAQARARLKKKELDVKFQCLVKEQIVEKERQQAIDKLRRRVGTPDIDETQLTSLPTETRRAAAASPTDEHVKQVWRAELDAQMVLHQRKKLAGHLVTSIARSDPLV